MENLLATLADLFKEYDLGTIVSIILMAFFGFVEICRGIDYFKDKKKDKSKEEMIEEKRISSLETKEGNNEVSIGKLEDEISELRESVNQLLESDKCSIKAWITEKHQYYMKKGEIDNYTLDCIHRRFTCYKAVGGNSFVQDMVNDLDKLKRSDR